MKKIAVLVLLCLLFVANTHAAEPARSYSSPQHPVLNAIAQQHAENMARLNNLGHFGASSRFAKMREATGLKRPAEICARVWRSSGYETWAEQWRAYAQTWRTSPAHWRVARVQHKLIGVGSARAKNGTWYGCLISID